MKNILFPKGFRTIGWLLFIPATIMGILIYMNLCSLSGIAETVVNDAVIIGIALGAVFIVCSKEVNEDEMTRSIRLAALLNSLYIYVILLITSTLLINGIAFMEFAIINLVLLPMIYTATTKYATMKNRSKVERAEKDITQQQLAEAVGVSRQTIVAIEKNRFLPSTPLALKIARYFSKPVESIFILEDND